MRKLGLIGGLTFEASTKYETLINRAVRERLGGSHSADLIIRSYDFHLIERLQGEGRWSEVARMVADDVAMMEFGGADGILICCNLMHKIYDEVSAGARVPLVNVIDATAERVKAQGLDTVLLLGGRLTMDGAFYQSRMASHGIDVVVPAGSDHALVTSVINDEMVQGKFEPASREAVKAMADRLVGDGPAQGLVAGCVDLERLLSARADFDYPYFSSVEIHCDAAVEFVLQPLEVMSQGSGATSSVPGA